jgi:hypothetical protein
MASFLVGRGVSDLTTPLTGIATGDTVSFVEGSLAITQGLNVTAAIGQLVNVNITPESLRHIGGGASGPLQLGASGAVEFAGAGGSLTIQPECTNDGSTNADTIANLILSGGASTQVNVVGGGTVTSIRQTSGNLTVADAVVVTNASINNGQHSINFNSTGLSSYIQSGGSVILRRGIANSGIVQIAGGSLLWSRVDSSATTGLTIGTSVRIDITGPGVVTWMGGNNSSATVIPALNLLHPGARFYAQNMPGDTTITTVTGHPEALAMSGFTNPAGSATYTTSTKRTLAVTNAPVVLGGSIISTIAGKGLQSFSL